MFSCSFLSSRLVHEAVVVGVVMSSIYSLSEGRRKSKLSCCPPTTHLEARDGAACHDANLQALPRGGKL